MDLRWSLTTTTTTTVVQCYPTPWTMKKNGISICDGVLHWGVQWNENEVNSTEHNENLVDANQIRMNFRKRMKEKQREICEHFEVVANQDDLWKLPTCFD